MSVHWVQTSSWKLWGQGKRPSPWLLLAGGVGLLLVILGSWLGRERAPLPPATPVQQHSPAPAVAIDRLAGDLEGILSRVTGAGQVKVRISYRGGPQRQVAENTTHTARRTEEREPAGSVRVITEEQETVQAVMAQAEPVILQEQAPEITGVLVVASGASDPYLRERLSRTVQTVLGVPAHRVEVVPGR